MAVFLVTMCDRRAVLGEKVNAKPRNYRAVNLFRNLGVICEPQAAQRDLDLAFVLSCWRSIRTHSNECIRNVRASIPIGHGASEHRRDAAL